MAPPKYNLSQVLSKLHQLTAAGKLEWRSNERLTRSRDNVVGHAYTTKFSDRVFALFEYRYAYYVDEDDWSWQYSVALELVDDDGRVLWEFQVTELQPQLRMLLEGVRHQTAGVDDLFAKLMTVDVD